MVMGRGSGIETLAASTPSRNHLMRAKPSRVCDKQSYQRLIDEHTLPEKGSYNNKFVNAIQFYAHVGAKINAHIRQYAVDGNVKAASYGLHPAGYLDAVMGKTSQTITVLRGMRFDSDQDIDNLVVPHVSFMGTTLSLSEAKLFANPKKDTQGVVFEIVVPKRTPYLPVVKYVKAHSFDDYAAKEAELLLGRNHSLVVEDIQKQYKAKHGPIYYCRTRLEKVENELVLPDKYRYQIRK